MPMPAVKGFTLIELIIVMLLLGILAVTALPPLMDRGQFNAAAYQTRVLSALQNMQARAMQDTRPGFCFQINFINSSGGNLPAFGVATNDYSAANQANTCNTSINFALSDESTPYTRASEMSDAGVRLIASSLAGAGANIHYLRFNSLGRPLNNIDNCQQGCQVELLTDGPNLRVCVSAQGYIYPADTLSGASC